MDSFYRALRGKHNHVCKHAKSNKAMCVVCVVWFNDTHNKEPNQSVDCKEDWISFLPSICNTHKLFLVFIKSDGPSYQIWRWGNSKCSSITRLLLWCSIWEKVLPCTFYELILLNKYGCFSSVLAIEDREGLNLKSSVHCFSKSSLVFFQEV